MYWAYGVEFSVLLENTLLQLNTGLLKFLSKCSNCFLKFMTDGSQEPTSFKIAVFRRPHLWVASSRFGVPSLEHWSTYSTANVRPCTVLSRKLTLYRKNMLALNKQKYLMPVNT